MLKSQDCAEQHFQMPQSWSKIISALHFFTSRCLQMWQYTASRFHSLLLTVHQVNTKEIIVVIAIGYLILNV